MSKSYEMDMSRGAIFPKLLAFSLPLMLSGILQLLFNAADVIVVGRFVGSDQMAAVGSTSSLINLIVNFFGGLSVGVSVLAAQNYAAGQGRELSKTISTAFMTALLSGLLLILIGTALARPLLELMGSPSGSISSGCRPLWSMILRRGSCGPRGIRNAPSIISSPRALSMSL